MTNDITQPQPTSTETSVTEPNAAQPINHTITNVWTKNKRKTFLLISVITGVIALVFAGLYFLKIDDKSTATTETAALMNQKASLTDLPPLFNIENQEWDVDSVASLKQGKIKIDILKI